MSSESPPASTPRPKAIAKATKREGGAGTPLAPKVVDWILIAAFLALAFLLGVFPLKDTDFWWHLRTGDLIRQTGHVPDKDLYTFTAQDHRWVDLHWLFQVAISWGYSRGGVVALNLAKCAITCAALALLVTAKRRTWPSWVMVASWIPALLVMSGRMYVRPETLTLLYLSAFLAILFRWERVPELALALPLIELAWVNTQGLFVFGPIVLTFALIDAALRPGAFAPERKRWWRIVGIATVLTGLACFVNPYGLTGALYPLQLASTMGDPVFRDNIAELTPIPDFIVRNGGWDNLPLQLHLATMVVGGLSFLIPMTWTAFVRIRSVRPPEGEGPPSSPEKDSKTKGKGKRSRKKKAPGRPSRDDVEPTWRLSPFRLLLYVAFSYLSWQATRNSHQFAAVVGAVTAWNFGEWAAAIRARSAAHTRADLGLVMLPRLVTLGGLALLFGMVASGTLYAMAREGRTIGLGEEPLWYPHEAVKFSGKLGMPERFLSFHDGYAALYEYYHGPERKVFADARLEVMGRDLYQQYTDLRRLIAEDKGDWPRVLDGLGRPAILVGHEYNASLGVNLMKDPHWRCVWFDPIVAVFVHDAYRGAVESHQVDFAGRHFHPDAASEPRGLPALKATGKALWHYASLLQAHRRPDLARPLVLLGLDYARRIRQAEPASAEGWKLTGEIESAREVPSEQPVPRYRFALDPVFDLSSFRATYALRRAHEAAPEDFLTLLLLSREYQQRGMDEAALPLLERLTSLRPINQEQLRTQDETRSRILGQVAAALGPEPPGTWKNLSELDRVVTGLLRHGRAGSAADLLERAYPEEPRPWEVTDRIATLRLHLGDPKRARELWSRAASPPRAAVRAARIGTTYLVEGDFEPARRDFREALRLDPALFEAHYGLAVLEQDDGHAPEALAAAQKAVEEAPGEVARSAARAIVSAVTPYARP